MSTIGEKIANQIAENNGIYPGDPQAYAVIEYENCFQDNQSNFAVCYSLADLQRYTAYHKINRYLWRKEEPKGNFKGESHGKKS